MKYLLIIFSLFLFNSISGQDSLIYGKPINFSISFLEYLPFGEQNTANFNIGTEFYLKNNHSIYFNLGYLHSYGLPFIEEWFGPLLSHEASESSGIKVQIEKRKYLNKYKKQKVLYLLFWPHLFQPETSSQNSGYYFAFGTSGSFLITQKAQFVHVYQNEIYMTSYEGLYRQHRNEFIANIQYGYKSIINRGLVLDFSLGFGIQYVIKYTTDKINDSYLSIEDFEENKKSFYPFWFTAKMRVGWNFNRKN